MLALTRRKGEEVVIGDPRDPLGVIRVVEISGDKVKLSFDFPRDTDINRRELAEQKARQAREDESRGGPAKPPAGGAEPFSKDRPTPNAAAKVDASDAGESAQAPKESGPVNRNPAKAKSDGSRPRR